MNSNEALFVLFIISSWIFSLTSVICGLHQDRFHSQHDLIPLDTNVIWIHPLDGWNIWHGDVLDGKSRWFDYGCYDKFIRVYLPAPVHVESRQEHTDHAAQKTRLRSEPMPVGKKWNFSIQCDCVQSFSTSLQHTAGAMETPVWTPQLAISKFLWTLVWWFLKIPKHPTLNHL